jgi:hypothetical protein
MNKKTQVKCSGMTLTAGFHAANPPLIWRFDLERNHSFTLALQGEEGDWELGVTSAKGDFYPVVHFLAREDAEDAFAKIEKALSRKRGTASYLLKAFLIVVGLAVAVVFGVIFFASYLMHEATHPMASILKKPTSMYAPPAVVQPQEGVPQSADEVLQPPPK